LDEVVALGLERMVERLDEQDPAPILTAEGNEDWLSESDFENLLKETTMDTLAGIMRH
jgi:hypothetical protein